MRCLEKLLERDLCFFTDLERDFLFFTDLERDFLFFADLERDLLFFIDLERDLFFFSDLERDLRFFTDLERDLDLRLLADLDRDRDFFFLDMERDLLPVLDIDRCPLVDSASLLSFSLGFLDFTGDLESSFESLEDVDLRLLVLEEFCDLFGDLDRGFCDGRLVDLSGVRDLDLLELAVLNVFEFLGDLLESERE